MMMLAVGYLLQYRVICLELVGKESYCSKARRLISRSLRGLLDAVVTESLPQSLGPVEVLE